MLGAQQRLLVAVLVAVGLAVLEQTDTLALQTAVWA
jgi:hypothetical protein